MVEPVRHVSRYGRVSEVFPLPNDEAFLYALLRDIFEKYWPDIVFGPVIEGAAFEFRCATAPTKIALFDGYLTIDLGGPHFHLCIGENKGSAANPTPPEQRRHRRATRVELFRGLDPKGDPVTWGLNLANGNDEQLCTIFFPNPFLGADGRLAPAPDWSKLEIWDALTARCLGRDADPRDRAAPRFYHG
ncbi:MAG: DUF7676 family protein [Gammaproteobacteria bacterium]